MWRKIQAKPLQLQNLLSTSKYPKAKLEGINPIDIQLSTEESSFPIKLMQPSVSSENNEKFIWQFIQIAHYDVCSPSINEVV